MKIIALLKAIILILETLLTLGIVKEEDVGKVAKTAVNAAIKDA